MSLEHRLMLVDAFERYPLPTTQETETSTSIAEESEGIESEHSTYRFEQIQGSNGDTAPAVALNIQAVP